MDFLKTSFERFMDFLKTSFERFMDFLKTSFERQNYESQRRLLYVVDEIKDDIRTFEYLKNIF